MDMTMFLVFITPIVLVFLIFGFCMSKKKVAQPNRFGILPIVAPVAANTTINPVQPVAAVAATSASDHLTRDGETIMLAIASVDEENTHNSLNKTGIDENESSLVNAFKDWWIDTGATRHVCFDRDLFVEYKEFGNDDLEDNSYLYMGNDSEAAASSKAMGQGKVVLKFTSGEEVSLNEVMYVPDIRKNLISGSMLVSKEGFRMIIESNKLVLSTKGEEMYVGKACLADDGLFKLR